MQPVGHADQLLQVGGDQQHRQARPPWRCAGVPRSRPARRRRPRGSGCEAISRTGSSLISRPTISFCWLPPDSEAAVTSMPGVRTSKVVDDPPGVGLGRRPVEQEAAGRRRAGSGGRGSGSPRAMPSRISPCRCRSSGMKPTPASRRRGGGQVGRCPSPASSIVPRGDRPDAHDRVHQLGLAVALDAGDAEHLAGVDGQVDVGQHVPAADRRRRPGPRTAAAPPGR